MRRPPDSFFQLIGTPKVRRNKIALISVIAKSAPVAESHQSSAKSSAKATTLFDQPYNSPRWRAAPRRPRQEAAEEMPYVPRLLR